MANDSLGVREFFIIPNGPTCLIVIHSNMEREAIELISLYGELSLIEDQRLRDELQAAIKQQTRKLRETIIKASVLEYQDRDEDDEPEAYIGFQ